MALVVLGAGRGGGHVLVLLAEAGCVSFVIFDDDLLEDHNIPNHVLDESWLNRPKAGGLAHMLSSLWGAEATAAIVRFEPALLENDDRIAALVYGQDLILALTDDYETQLAAAATAAALEIPFIASAIAADGRGEVFAQLDVDQDGCFACFTVDRRRAVGETTQLSGRDRTPGTGNATDQFVADVALAILNRDSSLVERTLATDPNFGFRHAWNVAPDGSAPEQLVFDRNRYCPICGDGARARRKGIGATGVEAGAASEASGTTRPRGATRVRPPTQTAPAEPSTIDARFSRTGSSRLFTSTLLIAVLLSCLAIAAPARHAVSDGIAFATDTPGSAPLDFASNHARERAVEAWIEGKTPAEECPLMTGAMRARLRRRNSAASCYEITQWGSGNEADRIRVGQRRGDRAVVTAKHRTGKWHRYMLDKVGGRWLIDCDDTRDGRREPDCEGL